MGGDKNRLLGSLKSGWNLIFEGILEQNREAQILNESHPTLQQSLEEINKNLQELSHMRQHLHRRLEHIKNEIAGLQLRCSALIGAEKDSVEHTILVLEEEGHALQIELDSLEKRLRGLRTCESSQGSSQFF